MPEADKEGERYSGRSAAGRAGLFPQRLATSSTGA